MIAGLVSSYRDPLLRGAVESLLEGCDFVIVGEGPSLEAEPPPPDGTALELADTIPNVHLIESTWTDEAAKKNELLHAARRVAGGAFAGDQWLWLVWLDSDELLLWARHLPDYARHVAGESSVGGWALRIVEPDGSVYRNSGRIARADLIGRYLYDWTQVELTSGMVVAFSHDLLCTAGGIPALDMGAYNAATQEEKLELMARHRPPLQGEPHIVHRWNLRPPERQARALRMSTEEGDWWSRASAS